MFQLIISILAIILAVALAGVSVYYGGSAFSNGSEAAQFATLTNQGSQIEAGATLFRAQKGVSLESLHGLTEAQVIATKVTDAVNVAGLDTDNTAEVDSENIFKVLVATDYLKQVPSEEWKLDDNTDYIYVEGVSDAVCAGNDDVIYSTGTTPFTTKTLAVAAIEGAGVSGCVANDDASGNIFFYAL